MPHTKTASTDKCKILFFVYIFGQGGAERVILNILNHIDNQKYDITLILGQRGEQNRYLPFLTNHNVHLDYLDIPLGQYNHAISALAQKINQYNPDILFTEAKYTNSISYHAKKLSKNRKVKLIFREAVNRSACQDENLIAKLKVSLHYNFGPQKIICISKGVSKDLTKHYGVCRNKLITIYNPIDLKFIKQQSKEPIKDKTFQNIKGQKIITIGRLTQSKNQKLLLDAFSNLKNSASLIILGSGELENELKDYCIKKAIKNVYFLGNVTNPYQYLNACDIFVLSSIREGFGNVITESMATGTPVISTDCPSGPKEIIDNNQYGLLIPINNPTLLTNAMDQLLNDKSLRKKYSIQGKKRSQDFAVTKIVKQYEKVIDKVYQRNKK